MAGYSKILIPLDGSECSERALAEAHHLQEAYQAAVVLMYVVSDPDFDGALGSPSVMTENIQHDCAEGEAYLEKHKAQLVGEVTTVVRVGNIANTIIEEADKQGVDLIVMGSQGLGSALRRFLVGSVAKRVLSEAKQSVLIVR